MNKDWNRLYADVDAWAQSHRDEFVADISLVCRIRSVSVKDFSNPDEPFGKPCRDMLERCFEMSRRYGFAGNALFDLDITLEKQILPYLRLGIW